MTDSYTNMNHLWAGLLIEELVRCGVSFFCISPGSRSAPLTLAVAEHPTVEKVWHYDERSAAFYALGYAKAIGKPAALVCTSGSAVANYWPAVVEASVSRIPLILLTADRPPELLDTGANQAIDQINIFGRYVRWFYSLPCPDFSIQPQMVLTTAGQAVYRALNAPAGPVHINCMFREPLAPEPQPDGLEAYLEPLRTWRTSNDPYTTWHVPRRTLTTVQQRRILMAVTAAQRGALVIGRLTSKQEAYAVHALATALKWPVFPDVTSGLRMGTEHPLFVHYYDILLLSEAFRRSMEIELILHVGGELVSKRFIEFLGTRRVPYYLVSDHPCRHDPLHCVTERFEISPLDFATWLEPSVREGIHKDWGEPLGRASQLAGQTLNDLLNKEHEKLTEPKIARLISQLRPKGSILFCGNSLPVRMVDMFADAAGPHGAVVANRGASGIDGNISTALGFAQARKQPLTVLVGDLTALHDLNGLFFARNAQIPMVIVVINNDGGGIFSFLPIHDYPKHFERWFGTPHGMTLQHAAGLFGLDYFAPKTATDFADTYQKALERPGAAVIEVRTDREETLQVTRALQQAVVSAVEAAWGR